MKTLATSTIASSLLISATAMAQTAPSIEEIVESAIASGDTEALDAIAKYVPAESDTAIKIQSYKTAVAAEAAEAEAAKKQGGLFDNWEGSGQLGGFQSSGNTSSVGVTAGINLTKEGEKWRYKFRTIADYQRTNGTTDREQFLVALEPNYKFNDRLFAYGLAQYERDRFQGFSARYTLSGGLGYSVIKTDKMQLDVKAGPAWRKTNLIGGGSTSDIAGLAAANYSWKINPAITFTQDLSAYVQSGNSTYTSLTGLDAKLSDKLSARLSYQLEHETNPPLGLKSTDTLTRATLVFGF
ncbi:MAG: DUF481 domain-containing protein [Parasphingorhabdus sp.]|uniref:DUF481 domain-containing protein n=1 Tax=Parasphingorhabdus sp. TaxID=2709688 RepID=UPI003297C558